MHIHINIYKHTYIFVFVFLRLCTMKICHALCDTANKITRKMPALLEWLSLIVVSCFLQVVSLCAHVWSDESQKGVITIQGCSIENQKGTITVQEVYGDIVPFWFSLEHRWTAVTPFWFSAEDIVLARYSVYNWSTNVDFIYLDGILSDLRQFTLKVVCSICRHKMWHYMNIMVCS